MPDDLEARNEYLRHQQGKRIMDYNGDAQVIIGLAQEKLRELRLADDQDKAEELSTLLKQAHDHMTILTDWVDRGEIMDETKLVELLNVNWARQYSEFLSKYQL